MPVPAKPDTAEIAAPEATGGVGVPASVLVGELGAAADPRQWANEPTGTAAAQAALRDPHARAVLDQRLDAGTAVPLDIEPGGTARRDRLAAESLREQFAAIEIDRISREMLHAVWYGYAVAEAIWELDGDRVRIGDLKVRDPARFRWRADGTVLLVTRENPRGAGLPPAKFAVLRQPRQHGGQPFGPGAARWCLWPVWLKRQAMRMWAVALERFGAPTAVVTVPRDTSPADKDKALRSLVAQATGGNLVVPEGQEINILDSARRAGGDYGNFIAAMDSMIADVVLGQRATSEIGPWQATAEAHKEVLERMVAADARRLCAALRQSVAAWLTEWNFPGAAVPMLARDTAPPEDLEARAKRDETVARMSGLRPAKAYIEQTYGGEWEDAPEPPGRDNPGRRFAFAGEAATDAISAAALAAAEGWEPLMAPVVEPLMAEARAGLERGESLEDFRARLPALFARMDDSALVETLRRMGFSARLSGGAGLIDGV